MRKLLFLPLLALLASCEKDEECEHNNPRPEELVAPALYATIGQDTANPYDGPLEVLPCQPNSSTYLGNYTAAGIQMPIPAYYTIKEGTGKSENAPLRLPAGTYDIVYWGYPLVYNTDDAAFSDPELILGKPLSTVTMGLRKIPTDTVCYPVHDLVFGIQNINVGKDDLHAHLKRATAALGVVASESNGKAFSDAIDSMWIYIGGIYSNLNFYTAEPEGPSKTIRFGMSPSADRKQWLKEFVSIFPSRPNPDFQIFIRLKDGTIKHYRQRLASQLSAGTKTTVNLSMDGLLLEEGSTGGFDVDQWKEQNDSIHIPLN